MSISRSLVLGLSLLVPASLAAPSAFGAEGKPAAKTQTVKAGGVTFEAPATWKSLPPTSAMRKAVLSVPSPTKESKDVAELVVFVFPGGAGTVEQNVERWRGQFKNSKGGPAEVSSKKVKGKNVDVTRVAVDGEYTNALTKETAKPDFRLLGGIVETPDASYYLKLVGPKSVVDAAEKDFDTLLTTIKAPGK